MRQLLAAATIAAWALAAPAAGEPATIGEVLACEGDADPAACLLRAGARDWNGGSDQGIAAMSAIIRFNLDDDTLGLDADASDSIAIARALAEASRLEATGARATRVAAPLARLPGLARYDAYRLFAFGPDSFVFPVEAWRFRAASPDTVRLVLRRLEREEADFSESDAHALAVAYASQGMAQEGRALLRRHRAEAGATAYWRAVGDFDAAEHALRADGDVNPMALINVAGAAAEAGDHARAARLAHELLDDFVRGRSARIIIAHDRVALAEAAATILNAAGHAEQARAYAHALMEGWAPDSDLFGSHADYAIVMLTTIGDMDGGCAIARMLAANIETPVADSALDPDEEVRARADTAAIALARCGDSAAARVVAARHGVEDFWLSFYLGDAFDALDPPYVGGLALAIEADLAAGRAARAAQLMQILFVRNPYYAAGVMHGDEASSHALREAWRDGGAFAGLRAALVRGERAEASTLTRDEREYVFAAALMLAGAP